MIESTAVSFDMCRQRCFSSLSFLHFLPAFATVHSFREFNGRRVDHNLPTKCVHLTRGLIKKREGRVRGERGEGEGWLGGSGREQVQLHCRDPCDCTSNRRGGWMRSRNKCQLWRPESSPGTSQCQVLFCGWEWTLHYGWTLLPFCRFSSSPCSYHTPQKDPLWLRHLCNIANQRRQGGRLAAEYRVTSFFFLPSFYIQ